MSANGNGRSEGKTRSQARALEEAGVYRQPAPMVEDPLQINLGYLHNPENVLGMAKYNRGEDSDTADLYTFGQLMRNPVLRGLAKNRSHATRGRDGFGSNQIVEAMRRVAKPNNGPTRHGWFGRKTENPDD